MQRNANKQIWILTFEGEPDFLYINNNPEEEEHF